MKPVVTVFGTCRVYEPIKILADLGNVSLNNDMVFGYTHTTKELLQMLKLQSGEFDCDKQTRKFIVKKIEHYETAKNKHFKDSQVTFIELSSLRLFSLNGVYLRSNLIYWFLNTLLSDAEVFWNDVIHQRKKPISDYSTLKELSDEEKFVIKNITCKIQTQDDFLADLEEIYTYIPKGQQLVFVSHFDMKVKNSEVRVPERVNIYKWLKEYCEKKRKNHIFNPRYLLEEYGYGNGLLDNSHYTKRFETELSSTFMNLLEKLN